MGFVRDLTGKTSANAAKTAGETLADSGQQAIEVQQDSAGRAQDYLTPYAGAAEQGDHDPILGDFAGIGDLFRDFEQLLR